MKTRVLLTAILLIMFAAAVSAQDEAQASTDQINVKELLDKQIEEIKDNRIAPVNTAQNEDAKEEVKEETLIAGIQGALDKEMFTKMFIILEAAFIAALVIIWRRKKQSRRVDQSVLKLNISRLRDEQIGSVEDKKLSAIRSGLAYKPINMNVPGSGITATAKKLAISKGEVHLAAKIKILANGR